MPTQVQWRRGTTAQTAIFTGAVAEITVDTDKNTLVVHDGSTAGGFALATEVNLTSNSIFIQSAYDHANSGFDSANLADLKAVTSGTYANAAFDQANTNATDITTIQGVNLTQNTNITTAQNSADAAFVRANNSLDANNGGVITGEVTIQGNLTVLGTQTTVNSTVILISDNIITLNAAIDQASAPIFDAGIEIDRGSSANVILKWNETTDKWTVTNDGANYFNIGADSGEIYANAAFEAANTASAAAVAAEGNALAFAIALG